MSSQNVSVSRAAASDPAEALEAYVEAQFAAALEMKAALELTQTGIGNLANKWEVFAWGPWQDFAPTPGPYRPGRIIMTGEEAFIAAGVWLNDAMLTDLVGFGSHIELFFFTANTQTMQPLTTLDHRCCICPVKGKNFYACVWKFTPTVAACLYETNICARVCSCKNKLVPDYAGFVRHVFDFDPETLFPSIPPGTTTPQPPNVPVVSPTPSWQFDRPIRYMVANRDAQCECPPCP